MAPAVPLGLPKVIARFAVAQLVEEAPVVVVDAARVVVVVDTAVGLVVVATAVAAAGDYTARIDGADACLFDGTFWTSDELPRLGLGTWQMRGTACTDAVLGALHTAWKRRIELNQRSGGKKPAAKKRALTKTDVRALGNKPGA